ncbi:MAG: MlaD family protein [Bacteroidales bacterium]|nr:MlaD family protein [Bacteroidales bacterium]
MKISNEVKIGIVALLTILVFIWLYNFLKGKEYFKKTAYYYSIYDNISGLAESSPVEINGFKVGVVQSIELLNPESDKILVTFSVGKNFKLPKNTVAEIVPVSLIAGMKVHFVYGEGPGTYAYGDTIPGRLPESIITRLEAELLPVKDRITALINSIDSVVSSVNEIMDPGFKKNLNGIVDNLNSTTESFDKIIGSKETELKTSLDNLTRFSQMLADNSSNMSSTFSNLESITDTLAAADIYNTVLNLKSGLKKTALLLENMNEGKGSAGQLLTNDSLYTNLSQSLESLNELLKDMKANPKRYVHFSIFGKKNIPTD